MIITLLVQAVTVLFFYCKATSAICYFPDGNVTQQDTPCLPEQIAAGRASFCCGSGYACTSDKLCKATSLSGNVNFTRGSCTDKTWNSPDCPSFCLDYLHGGVGVNQCGKPYDTEFCCTDQAAPCNCSGDSGVLNFFSEYTIITTIGFVATTSSQSTTTDSPSTSTNSQSTSVSTSTTAISSSSTTSATSSSGSSTATSQPQTSGQQNSSTNTTAIAIAIPVSVVALLLALAIFLFYRHHHKKSSTVYRESQPSYPAMTASSQPYKDNPQNKSHPFTPYPVQEIGRHSPPLPELPNSPMSPQELQGFR